jgi:flagellin-like protein
MSAKTKRIERSQRFRRAWRGQNRAKAVSPVVATLILILIAVAAAAALYLWLVAWQGNITGGIGQPSAQYTVTIGGSTSVYPFSSLGATWFEQNNSDVVVSDNQGGTGAGMLAVCSGNVEVGAASTPEATAVLQEPISAGGYACPTQPGLTITTIAYDAVDVVIQGANTHGLLSINADTLNDIYAQGSTTAPYVPVTATSTMDGAPFSGVNMPAIPAQGTEFLWSNIPAAVQGASFTGIIPATDNSEVATTVAPAAGVACAGPGFTNDICATAGPGDGTPCGFTVCAGPLGTTAAIVPVERSDASGTTQTFEAKMLGYTASNKISTTFAGLGYSGCGSNNYLSDCGIILPTSSQYNGNPAVLAAVGSNANAIGYASDGLARTATGVGSAGIIPFAGVGQVSAAGVPQSGSGFVQTSGANFAYNGVAVTTGGSGTIAGGILTSTTINNYAGWRPFEFVTLQPPTGEVQRFFQFIEDPANNANLATATGEVSIYSL